MSQGSNFKKEVMEALFNAPTNLINNKAIMWAASNLPDEGGRGENSTFVRSPYNHDHESFWTAIGMPGEDMDSINNKYKKALVEYAISAEENPKSTKSMAFEFIEKKLGYEGIMFMAVHGFMDFYNQMQGAAKSSITEEDLSDAPEELRGLLKHLIELRKRLGGGK